MFISSIIHDRKRKKEALLSHAWLFATPWTVADQAPPSMGFSRQKYWSGLPFPSPVQMSIKWWMPSIPWGRLIFWISFGRHLACQKEHWCSSQTDLSLNPSTITYQLVTLCKASLVAQTVKCLPTMWETQVRSLGQEDPLEKEMATHSSTFAWKIPWMEEHARLQSMGSQRVGHD